MDSDKNVLNYIWDTKQAAENWGLSQERIKQLATNGEIRAKKIGSSWAIDNSQPNPKKYKKRK